MSDLKSKSSWFIIFSCGVVCGIMLTALTGGVAYWYTNTRLIDPEQARPANARPAVRITIPRTFMRAEDNGSYENLLVKKIGQEPVVPFLNRGEQYWQAFVCQNAKCPGRAQENGRPYVFAGVVENGEISGCPLCAGEYAKAAPAQRPEYDPHNFLRYYLPEAIEMIREFREQIKEKNQTANKATVATENK